MPVERVTESDFDIIKEAAADLERSRKLRRELEMAYVLTEEQVSTVWVTLKKRYNAKVVDKRNSRKMKTVGYMMGKFGPMSSKDFMEYVTTVKRTIYYPNSGEIGHGDQEDLIQQTDLAAHEFTHVIQNIGYKYIFSSASLVQYETDAFIASMEMHHYLTGITLSTSYFLSKLKAYGVNKTDLAYAEIKFNAARKMVKLGKYRSETVKAIIDILE